jgi:hypothetical protein
VSLLRKQRKGDQFKDNFGKQFICKQLFNSDNKGEDSDIMFIQWNQKWSK